MAWALGAALRKNVIVGPFLVFFLTFFAVTERM